MSSASQDVRVARVGKPHGIRGEVTVELFTDSPAERFLQGNVLTVLGPEGAHPRFSTLTVASSRWNKHILLVKFTEIADRTTAETLRNAHLYVSSEGMFQTEEGWYADQLVGLEVYEGSFGGLSVGEVTALITGAAQDLLEIRLPDGREVLVPFVAEIVPEIDEDQGVVITPPPGLLELN